MDPVTGLIIGSAAINIIGSIYSWFQTDQAIDANAAERQKMQELLDKVQQPNFDYSKITPEEYKLVGKFVPEVVPVIDEKYPELNKNTQAMVEGQAAQKESLKMMQEIARQGKDPLAEIERAKAQRQAAQEASTQRSNIQAQMQRRGVGDSGLSLGMQQQAISDASLQNALAGEKSVEDSLSRRIQASLQAANLGQNIYQQEANQQSKNVDIINEFNRRMAQNKQNVAAQNVGITNEARLKNIANAQTLQNMNVGARNEAAIRQQDLTNRLNQQKYENELNKARVKTGIMEGSNQDRLAQAQSKGQLATGSAKALSNTALAYADYNKPTQNTENNKTNTILNPYRTLDSSSQFSNPVSDTREFNPGLFNRTKQENEVF